MKGTDFKLQAIYDKDSMTWCVNPKNKTFSGIIVQVDDLEDAPKEIARSFEIMFKLAIKNNHIEKIEFG